MDFGTDLTVWWGAFALFLMNFGATHTHLPLLEGNTINMFTNSLDFSHRQKSECMEKNTNCR
jgi:hypothetical protein